MKPIFSTHWPPLHWGSTSELGGRPRPGASPAPPPVPPPLPLAGVCQPWGSLLRLSLLRASRPWERGVGGPAAPTCPQLQRAGHLSEAKSGSQPADGGGVGVSDTGIVMVPKVVRPQKAAQGRKRGLSPPLENVVAPLFLGEATVVCEAPRGLMN